MASILIYSLNNIGGLFMLFTITLSTGKKIDLTKEEFEELLGNIKNDKNDQYYPCYPYKYEKFQPYQFPYPTIICETKDNK
jgi:hypothetical protein